VVNFDPVVDWLPDIPPGAGQAVSETAKQSLALAIVLVVLCGIAAAFVVLRPANSAANGFAGVIGASAVAAVVIFLVLLAVGGDDRRAFALGTLAVVAVSGISALLSAPSVTYANFSSRPLVSVVGGILLLVGYALAVQYLFSRAVTDDPTEWERLLALFAGVEAIAFAAAGAILGSEVQKGQTTVERDRANSNADVATTIAELAEPATGGDAGGAPANPQTQALARQQIAHLKSMIR
jgi:hypothetical protein